MPEDAPDHRHVGARAEPHVLVGMGGRAREARVADDERRVVLFLGLQYMLQPDRMRFRRVGAVQEDCARIVHVVEAVRSFPLGPGFGTTRYSGDWTTVV